jgi:hypothetical protein
VILARLKAFASFWYDFVVGDDWRVAVAVVAALVTTWAVHRSGVSAWWVAPAFFAVILPVTVWRAAAK